MKLRKAIFVTILIIVMLTAIDTCLYILNNPGFTVLTGAIIIYSFLRAACDFCRWLCKTEAEPEEQHNDRKSIERPRGQRDDGAIMKVLNEDV